ncbi:GW dipeptide domain-containing protein [Virgibacillus sp. SK37]|nr:GW dipeptide domain-containing protein [Virgibacillus sp. SK37]
MKKISISMIVILIFMTVSPLNIFAMNNMEGQNDEVSPTTEEIVDEQNVANESVDQETEVETEVERVEDINPSIDDSINEEEIEENSPTNDDSKEEIVADETKETTIEENDLEEETSTESDLDTTIIQDKEENELQDSSKKPDSKVFTSSPVIKEESVSKLGHIRSENANIYENINNLSSPFKAGSNGTNAVYYIKKQANVAGEIYYLISKQPSSVNGVVGWVKSKDLSTNTHVGIDKKPKTFYFKGTGSAYSKAWGGSKDLVYGNMSNYAGKEFQVHLTEKVGSNTWYRGNFNGKTIWLHSSYLYTSEEHPTSKLGHIRHSNVKIYNKDNLSSYKLAGSTYTNAVYYIKKQKNIGNKKYYLISKQPSSVNGVVGWVESGDLSIHTHVGVDKNSKTFYIKGTGSAYSKAWGGSKDLVYKNMSRYANKEFKVHLTEKVGNNTWYRGNLDGKTIWLHSSYLYKVEEKPTSKLGHIRNSKVKIYDKDNLSSNKLAGSSYTNVVYYIKKQKDIGNQRYYLISKQPSSVNGVVGWVKSEDLSTHNHVGGDKNDKKFFIKGTGKSFSKAWGGSKDHVYNLSKHKGEIFNVHLTEKVGNNIWYRGNLNGKIVWIHSNYLSNEVSTSKLGHISNNQVNLYKDLNNTSSSFKAGSTYTNA